MAPMDTGTAQTVSILINTGVSVALQIAEFLRRSGHEAEATQVEALLAHSDEQLRIVLSRAREAQGLPPLS